MGLSVNTNVAALTVHRHLAGTGSTLATSLQRLSTGMRINSARDDAAGLAITERMTTQVRGNTMAARNANDGISYLQTAEGALASIGDDLMRMRDLAVQAGNSMMSDADRQALQAEVAQLKQEVDRISSSAKFNGEFIFDQSRSSVVGNLEQLAVLDGLQNGGWLADAERLISEQYGIKADGAKMTIEITAFTDGAGGTAARVASSAVASGKASNITLQVDMADFVPPNLPNGGSAPFYNDRIIAHEMVHAVMARSASWGEVRSDPNNLWFIEGAAEFIHGAEERVQADGVAATLADNISAWGGTSVDYSSAYVAMRYLHKQIQAAGGAGVQDMLQYLHNNAGKTLNDAFVNATRGAYASQAAFLSDYDANKAAFVASFNFSNADTGAIGGFDVDGGPVKTATNIIPDYPSGRGGDPTDGFSEVFESIAAGAGNGRFLSMQVGGNAGDSLTVSAGSANLGALGLEAVDIATSAGTSMAALDRALEYVFRQRARVGAQMSRLENVISTLDISNENLSASRGRMQDADFAAEAAQRSRTEILQQAGTAMMAQANSVPQLVLALLKF